MKLAKKLFALALALCMVCSLSITAFATGDVESAAPTDMSTVTITKSYKLIGAGESPAEEFVLTQTAKRVVDSEATEAPELTSISKASFAKGAAADPAATATFTVTLPKYEKVGIYEYTLSETAGNTAGVAYYGSDIKLIVTVVNGEDDNVRVAAVHTETAEGADKSDTFENTYSAGALIVSKTVTGNLGDKSKYFEFKVTLTGETDKTYGESYAVTGGSNTENPTSIKIDEETTFLLKDDETITIANLPYGVTYTVIETSYEDDGYKTTKTGDTGSINAAEQTAAFTNNKGGEVDTGITLDTLPYVMILAVAVIGSVALVMKKRYTV